MKTTAVFGLGSMGYGMAQSLLRAGHTVYGFDVVPEQEARFRDEGGASGELAAIAPKLDAVVVVVLNAAQTEEVLFGAPRAGGRRSDRTSGASDPAPLSGRMIHRRWHFLVVRD